MTRSTLEEPPERTARPKGRATVDRCTSLHPQDPAARITLDEWLGAVRVLESRPITPLTRQKLQDCRRIADELARVLAGTEPGEGTAAQRTLRAAVGSGRIQALSSMFACPGATFVELLVTAPWNLLGADDPPDLRTVRGAGAVLVAEALEWSRRRGCGGRVALQAENARSMGFYERVGFRRMAAGDRPLSLVPPGDRGWSPSIVRLALGVPGPEEEQSPWLVLEPPRCSLHEASFAMGGA